MINEITGREGGKAGVCVVSKDRFIYYEAESIISSLFHTLTKIFKV